MTSPRWLLFASIAACAPDDGTPPPGNAPPFVVLTSPADGAFYDIEAPVVVTGAVADANEPDLSVLVLTWGGIAAELGPAQAAADGTISFPIPDPPLGLQPLTVSVSDSGGLVTSLTLSLTVGVDGDGDGFAAPEDCDDGSTEVHPDAVEVCNGIDDDCANGIDDGVETFVWHPDADADGYGDPWKSVTTCEDRSLTHTLDDTDCDDGSSLLNHDDDDLDGVDSCAGDCDDTDPARFPAAVELCNGVDDNCGLVDEGFATSTWYADTDLDSYGDPLTVVVTCQDFSGTHVFDGTDCNDADATLNHDDLDVDGADTCAGDCDNLSATLNLDDLDVDGLDTCAGDCDDLDPTATFETNWLTDLDGDGYGAGVSLAFACTPVLGLVPEFLGVDCDDADDTVHPNATDVCEDGLDGDCDEMDPSCGPVGSFQVQAGPNWQLDPPIYNCIEACAFLFGGLDTDYHCSVNPGVLDYTAYLSGWGDPTYCTNPAAEDFSKADPNNPGYDCGAGACAYSAYVQDNCMNGETNYCWMR